MEEVVANARANSEERVQRAFSALLHLLVILILQLVDSRAPQDVIGIIPTSE